MGSATEHETEGFTTADLYRWREQHDDGRLELVDGLIYASEGYGSHDLERWRAQHPECRVELLQGVLVVTPSPRLAHQRVAAAIFAALLPAVPRGLELLFAPLDVLLPNGTVLQPDLVLAPTSARDAVGLDHLPVLVVEILSAGTRRYDVTAKQQSYAEAGIEHFWVVDPEDRTLILHELRGGSYAATGNAGPGEVLTIGAPLSVRLAVDDIIT